MTITHTQVETYLASKLAGRTIQLDPSLESAVKLGILIELVADALNSDDVLHKLRGDVQRNETNKATEGLK